MSQYLISVWHAPESDETPVYESDEQMQQAFAQVDILTGGDPLGQTETLVFKIFNKQSPADLGVASVMAVGLFGITFVTALFQFVILERRVHYGR